MDDNFFINQNIFTIEYYKQMIDKYTIEETWNKILFFLDKTRQNEITCELLKFDNLSSLYEIGLAYINKIDKKTFGKYYTPKDVGILMANLLLENNPIKIADVGCGTGNLIIEVLKLMIKRNLSPIEFIRGGNLYLYDYDKLALKICIKKIEILLNFKFSNNINIFLGDFLDKHIILPENISVISNPPYSIIKKIDDNWKKDEILLQSKDLYAGFISKILDFSSSAVIVSPQSYLVSDKFENLRKKLFSSYSGEIYSFDNVPATLFSGKKHGIFNSNSANGVRASIMSIKKNDHKGFRLTPLIRFKSIQRELVINIDFLKKMLGTKLQNLNPPLKVFKSLEKMVDEIYQSDLCYLKELIEFDGKKQNEKYKLYVSTSSRYFTVASKRKLNRKGFFIIYAKNQIFFNLLYLLLNSTYAYMWWRFLDGGILYTKRILFSSPLKKELINKAEENETIVKKMINLEKKYLSYKKNAGTMQESIKFPVKFRKLINEIFFPEYSSKMEIVHLNSIYIVHE